MQSKWFHHISYLSQMTALHQNVSNCQNTLTVLTLRWRIFLHVVMMRQMYVTEAGTTQDNFIHLAPPVRGLPISQGQIHGMKRIRNRTIPITFRSGKNMLLNVMFKTIIGYTNLGTRQVTSRPGSRAVLFITVNSNMACDSTQRKIRSFFDNLNWHTFLSPSQSSSIVKPGDREASLQNNKFGCNEIINLFKGFNDCSNFGSKFNMDAESGNR